MDASLQSMSQIAMMQAQSAVGARTAPGGDIDKAAQSFESMFATQMLQPMFEGIGVDPLFGGGHGEEIMRSFMVEQYGKIIGKKGLLGISTAVKTEMIRAQAQRDEEKAHPTARRGSYANHP
jgi:Rod binding domain-containing protein